MAVEGEAPNLLTRIYDRFGELVKRRPPEGGEMARRLSEANRRSRELREKQPEKPREKVEGS